MSRIVMLSTCAKTRRYFLPLAAASLAVIVAAADGGLAAASDPLADVRGAALERWSKDIEALERRDREQPDPADAILFLGSSSIRRWNDLAVDMAPYRTIKRGYGGAKYSDLAVFAERLIHPHDYRAVVIFVANDVSGKPTDNSPQEVEVFVRHIVSVARQHRPDSPVLLVEVTPTEKRWEHWDRIRQVNVRLREVALTTPSTYFVATAEDFIGSDGRPRADLFVEDRLHLNEQGYDLWSDLIRERLNRIFRLQAASAAFAPNPTSGTLAETSSE